MVIKMRQLGKNFREGAANQFGGPSKKDFSVPRIPQHKRETDNRPNRLEVVVSADEECVDVIDLGAPRRLRLAPPDLPRPARARERRVYTPNPRLYPGPEAKPKSKRRPRTEGRPGRARRRVFRRPVPNARLYRPAPRRLPPPAQPPRGPWPPPAPPAHGLDTASRVALRLASARRSATAAAPGPAPAPRAPAPTPPRSRRLVVTLPGAGAGMDAARHSTSPDDCSEADALSAPSEFLAEFLSAIMRRQYAEALKYCRLILQYEPHNATARGFYPLLRHKVQALKRSEGPGEAGVAGAAGAARSRRSSSDSSYSPAQQSPPGRSLSHSHSHSHSRSHSRSHQRVSGSSVSAVSAQSGRSGGSRRSASAAGARSWARSESEGSVASQSSLELDSTSGSASPAPPAAAPDAPDAPDANGNVTTHSTRPRPDDLENDNDVSRLQSESTCSLRRLRAQFACSIK